MSEPIERVLRELANAPSARDRWRDGAECPSERVLAALAEERLDEERAAGVRAHLARCGACVADVQAALAELEAVSLEARTQPAAPDSAHEVRPRLRLVASRAAWIGLAAAALILFLLRPFGPSDGGAIDPRAAVELARVEALPARVARGEADEAELAFREGLVHYVERRWDAAEVALAHAAALAPERADVALYRGSAALLDGRPADAIAPLEQASAAEGTPGREARWQLAQALLASGRPADARAALEVLAAGDPEDHRAADAREQLAEL
jgi:hypothetical protein